MKRILSITTALAVASIMLIGCASNNEEKIRSFEQLEGHSIVVQKGTMFETILKEQYPSYNVTSVPTFFGIYKTLVSGEAEYGLDEDVSASLILAGGLSIDTSYANQPPVPMGAIFNKSNTELKQQFDEFLTELDNSGKLAEIRTKWFNSIAPSSQPVPKCHVTEGTPIKAVIEADFPPFNLKNGKDISGLDVELLTMFADQINRPVELTILPFNELIPAVEQGKADMSISGISETDERKEHVLFSKPYNKTHMLIVSLKKVAY